MFTQCARTFGKLSRGHWTGKGQFSFQIQRQAMPKNVQITAQLQSTHVTVGLCSKSFKLGFSSIWTENFQMYKLGLQKAVGGGGGFVAKSCPTLATPRTEKPGRLQSMGFSRQEYWSGLSCPAPGNLPNLRIELMSLTSHALVGGFFTTSTTWEAPFGWILEVQLYHHASQSLTSSPQPQMWTPSATCLRGALSSSHCHNLCVPSLL